MVIGSIISLRIIAYRISAYEDEKSLLKLHLENLHSDYK